MQNPDIFTGRLGNRMFQIAFLYAQAREGNIPDWYLQDPKYFDKYAPEIRRMFGEGITQNDYVGIQVRRGGNPINPNEPDYSENSFYVNLCDNTDYYEQAMAMFPNRKFLVTSDDMKFCKEYFKGDQFTFSEEKTAVGALNELAGCRGMIIANSSFGWWAGYLSTGKVIAPSAKNWYSDSNENRTVCPLNWIRI